MSNKKILPHGLSVAYYIIDQEYVYGPFESMFIAESWLDCHQAKGEPRFFSLGPLQRIGTLETADSVGVVIK